MFPRFSGTLIFPLDFFLFNLSLSPGISTLLKPFAGLDVLISFKRSSEALYISELHRYFDVSIDTKSQFASVVDGPSKASPISSPINASP